MNANTQKDKETCVSAPELHSHAPNAHLWAPSACSCSCTWRMVLGA